MLRIVIPKGSLEKGTLKLFELADIPVKKKNDRDYKLFIDDPRVQEALILRPQEIPKYVEEGEFDLGITGLDWIKETQSVVKEIADLQFSKQGWRVVKIVLATDESNPVNNIGEMKPDARIVTEYPRLTKRFLKEKGKGRVSIRGSYGATEVKVPRLADYFVDVVETGETLRRNRKKIIAEIMNSSTKLIANMESWNTPEMRKDIEDIRSLLDGVLQAREKTLIKLNIPKEKIDILMDYIPSLRPPAISEFYSTGYRNNENWAMVEIVVEKSKLNIIIPKIRAIGAKDILEIDISKMIA